MSHKEQRELATLPATIEALETEQEAVQREIATPDFYRQDKDTIAAALARLELIGVKLATAYARWEELERLS